MAKSIRSKWKRKCRAVKRVRYGEKELDRLKKTLANDPLNKSLDSKEPLKDIEEIANVKTASEIQAQASQSAQADGSMELDEVTKKFDPKTYRDKNGAFPVWLHPRKIKKGNKGKKKNKVKKNKIKGKK
ncbi:protein LLP [Anthonomus grandis grandis]|uniref:protein LLP n=1 Tax=Anthonomus grandis grandis TaxID=2921223 RepID=UPI0021658657|nr:protein LLP [Anthonomus grandis grandis]